MIRLLILIALLVLSCASHQPEKADLGTCEPFECVTEADSSEVESYWSERDNQEE